MGKYTTEIQALQMLGLENMKTIQAMERRIGMLKIQNQELDDFIDYLVDKMDGDRVELMKSFLKEMND